MLIFLLDSSHIADNTLDNPPLKSVDGSLDPIKMVSTYMSSVSSNRYTLIDMMLTLVRDGSTCMSAAITSTQV